MLKFLSGGGDMGERIRTMDWRTRPVGPPAQWPLSLQSTVSLLLGCQLPMYLAWGPELTQFYNDAYRPILGDKHPQALSEAAPHTWGEIWPTIGPMWQQVLQGEAIGFDDFKLTIQRFAYPEDCYFNFSYSPVRDDKGQVAGVLVTFAETTKRVLTERRLRFLDDLSQRTRTLTDPSEVMTVAATMLGQHLEVNRCAYATVHEDQDTFDLIGDYTEGVASIVGRYRFRDFGAVVLDKMCRNEPYVNHDVDTDPSTAGSDLSAYRATQIQSVVCVPLHKNGRLVAAMAVHKARPRHWTTDEVELIRTTVDRCWDALERIRSEAVMREEARLLEVLNRTGAALSSELDLQTLLQRVTDAATELTGAGFGAFFYNGTDAQGEALLLYTLAGAPREAFSQFGHPRPTPLFGPTFRGEPPVRIADVATDPRYGQWEPHRGMPAHHLPVRSYLAVPVIARDGEVIGGLFFGHPEPGVFTERSEQLAVGIASQAAVAVDNARLYTRAQQASAEREALLESERAARSEAERASTLKDEFLATLSHELRTPMSAISGWAHILRRKLDATHPELIKGVEVIERSTKTQVQLIEDLLDMSRITSGKLRLDLQPMAPLTAVQAAIEVIRPSADAAGVTFEEELQPVPLVWGDANRLQQITWNLLANAVKFSARGGQVRVQLAQEGDTARIRVQDQGAGIAPDFLPHIFDRFRQADGSMARKFGGLGIGLSIVKHLVEAHGGSISVASGGIGHGATFSVVLPLMAETAVGASARPNDRRSDQDADLSGVRVLVVDDEADSRELVERVLRERGALVTVASDGPMGLDALQRMTPDVLVSDIGMPGMDGYELLRRVRRLPPERGGIVPAIAFTAFARSEDRERALQAGFTRHITKPFDPRELVWAIAHATPGQRSPARSPGRQIH